jgi:hypothetical protein
VAKPLRRPTGTAEHGCLGQDLGLCAGWRQRRGLNDTGVGGTTGARVQQVMSRLGIGVQPAALADPAGGDRSLAQRKGMQPGAVEGARDMDRTGDASPAPEADVAGAVDSEGVKLRESGRQLIGEDTLGHPAGIEQCSRPALDL